jgi:hypothetical protein
MCTAFLVLPSLCFVQYTTTAAAAAANFGPWHPRSSSNYAQSYSRRKKLISTYHSFSFAGISKHFLFH